MKPKKHDLSVIQQALEERDDALQQVELMAAETVYRGNSVQHWHAKATAYGNVIMRIWNVLAEADIKPGAGEDVVACVRVLAKRAAVREDEAHG